MKNILVLTDFSSPSIYAVETSFLLAEHHNATLFIYHQLEENETIQFELDYDPDFVFDDLGFLEQKHRLRQWQNQSVEKKIKTRYIVSAKDFISHINELVERLEIDLIIMGTTSEYERTDSKWFSNTQAVIKNVDCSVLVVKKAIVNSFFKKIVFASNFDQDDKEVFKYMFDLLKIDNHSEVHLLSIDTSSFFSQPKNIVTDVMNEFKEEIGHDNIIINFFPDLSIDSGIRNYIDQNNPDLLVMSNLKSKPIKHFFQGNHALWQVARATCPVLTLDFQREKV